MKNLNFKFKEICLAVLLSVLTFTAHSQDIWYNADVWFECAPTTVLFSYEGTVDTTNGFIGWNINGDTYFGNEVSVTFDYAGWNYVYLVAFDSLGNWLADFGEYYEVLGSPGNFNMSTEQACPGEWVNFGPNGDAWWVEWDFGDGNMSYEYNTGHMFELPGVYDVTMFFETDCGVDSIVQQVTVSSSAIPTANIWVDGGNWICPGDGFNCGTNFDASEYYWDFGDGNTSFEGNPWHTYQDTGIYELVVVITNSCGNTNSDTVYMNVVDDQQPYADFYFWPAMPCPGEYISFNSWSTGSFFWDFGDGNAQEGDQPMHVYADTGTYLVTCVVLNSCGNADTAYQYISIEYNLDNAPTAEIRFDSYMYDGMDAIEICPGTEVWFNNDSWSNGGNEYYFWYFGDGAYSTERDPSHIFDSIGDFNVGMVISNDCGAADTAWLFVSVNNSVMPNAQLQFLPDSICPGETVYFFDDNNEEDFVYSIWFGDGDSIVDFTGQTDTTIGVQAAHLYPNNGVYPVVFTATNSCGNTLTLNGNVVVDQNGASNPFYYVDNSTTNDNMSAEDFPDLSQPGGPLDHQFDMNVGYSNWTAGMNTDSYLIFWYGGSDVMNGDPGPPAGILSLTGEGQATAYVPVDGDSIFILGLWYCGVPFLSDPDGVAFVGAFPISNSGYTDIGNVDIQIMNICDSIGVPENPNAACPGDPVTFFAIGGISVEWSFGDSSPTDTNRFTMHTYDNTGLYDAYVIILNGCGSYDTVSTLVTVADNVFPDAWFSYDGGWCASEPVQFWYDGDYNEDNDINQYFWDFGDGTVSTERDPLHYFTSGGDFDVSLTVTNGCGSNTNMNYIYVAQPQVDAEIAPACPGENNAEIYLNIFNASYPVTILWSNGASTDYVSGLSLGTYTVTVTDDDGCSTVETFEVAESNALSLYTESMDASCNGYDDGEAFAAASGGIPPYWFNWSTGDNSETVSNLAPGSYFVDVYDQLGCLISDTIIINEPTMLTVNETVTDVDCQGNPSGAIELLASGGTAPYSFVWSTGDISSSVNYLTAGSYSVTVYDDNSCENIMNIDVNNAASQVLGLSIAGTDPFCFGGNDGAADLTVSGGITPYTYTWSNGETTEDISALEAGDYGIVVVDALGCEAYDMITMTEQLPEMNIITNHFDAACTVSDGQAWVESVTGGGLPPYSFLWNDIGSQTTDTAFNIPAGAYTVTVSTSDGCTSTEIAVVNNIGAATIDSMLIIDNYCFGDCSGASSLYASGGSTPYTYSWSNGETTSGISGLCAGSYTVTLEDASSCLEVAELVIQEPPLLTVGVITYDAQCNSDNDGATDLIVSGGVSPYVYMWSNSETTAGLDSITAGVYIYTVTDDAGCSLVDSVEIVEPSAVNISYMQNDVLCFGDNNGSIDLSVNAGVPPYSYNWSGGQTAPDLMDLIAGTYSVTVTDQNACESSTTIVLGEPAPLTGSITASTDALCFDECSGSATVSVTGGTTPYSYSWDTFIPQTNATATNLCAEEYFVMVYDANGCEAIDNITIYQPSELIMFVTSVPDEDYQCIGEATALVTGGVTPYSYLWDDTQSQTTVNATGLCTGFYNVVVTDDNGCSIADVVEVDHLVSIADNNVAKGLEIYPNPNNDGRFIIDFNDKSYSEVSIQLIDVTGKIIFRKQADTYLPVMNFHLNMLSPGMYYIQIIYDSKEAQLEKLVITGN